MDFILHTRFKGKTFRGRPNVYRVIYCQRTQGDLYIKNTGWSMATRYRWIHSHNIKGDQYLQQTGWPKDTGCMWSIAPGYRVIHNERVIIIFGPKIFVDNIFCWTYNLLDPTFFKIKNIFGLKKMFDRKYLLHPNFVWTQ